MEKQTFTIKSKRLYSLNMAKIVTYDLISRNGTFLQGEEFFTKLNKKTNWLIECKQYLRQILNHGGNN